MAKSKTPYFPNGFDSWQETHYEMVRYCLENEDNEDSFAHRHNDKYGRGGMYELARELTFKFEHENKGIVWGIDKEYDETLDLFLSIEEQYQVTIFKED